MSLGLAIKSFFKCLSNKEFATKIRELSIPKEELPVVEEPKIEVTQVTEPEKPKELIPATPQRSDAITLLSVLQREARLIDFLQEDISGFEDEQIGAAVREVHKKSAEVVKNYFKISPMIKQIEGDSYKVPSGFDPAEFQLSGKVSGNGPYNGTVEHCGWKAEKIELPKWQGKESTILIISPAEIEVNK